MLMVLGLALASATALAGCATDTTPTRTTNHTPNISDWTGNVVRVYDAETFEKITEISDVTTPTGIFSVTRRSEQLGH